MEQRVLDISFRHKQPHISSCLTTLPIFDYIFKTKKIDDILVLSSGHAGLALYCALEKYTGVNADELFEKHGVHPWRDVPNGIHVASGSLGSAVLVACGLAIGYPKKTIHVVISDGECAEGSVWEALRTRLPNICIHVNVNGFCAYDNVNIPYLWLRLKSFDYRTYIWFTKMNIDSPAELQGIQGHYHILKSEICKNTNEERFRFVSAQCYEVKLKTFCDYWRSWIRYIRYYTNRLSR
jgi:transketolase